MSFEQHAKNIQAATDLVGMVAGAIDAPLAEFNELLATEYESALAAFRSGDDDGTRAMMAALSRGFGLRKLVADAGTLQPSAN